MIMPTNLVCVLFATSLVFMLFPFTTYAGRWVCKPCQDQDECDAYPGLCIWGETRDSCNRRICAKGPGERCGGILNIFGECGEGLWCKGERCHGCSRLNFLDCYPKN